MDTKTLGNVPCVRKSLVEEHGCELLRAGGNHSVFVNRATGKTSTVPRHGVRPLPAKRA